jgi:hypothetical protein
MQHCIFYNKGEKMNIPNEIILENIGRESESYLRYIIDHYDHLPDIIVFTHANISDHPGENKIEYLYRLKQEAELHGKSNPFISFLQKNISDSPKWGPEFNVHEKDVYILNHYLRNQQISFKKWFLNNIMDTYPDPIHIFMDGLFAVKKELILQKPLAYYKYLIQFVNHHIDPVEGHFFERSWYYIFHK